MTPTEIGMTISEARMHAGLSLTGLAARMRDEGRPVSKGLLHYWEKGVRAPCRRDLVVLAHILGIPSVWADQATIVFEQQRDRISRRVAT